MMAYALTSKSQVTLPKAIRTHLKLAPGDKVQFRVVADGSVRIEPAMQPTKADSAALDAARKRFGALRGIARTPGEATLTTDELMNMLRGYDQDDTDPGFAPRPK